MIKETEDKAIQSHRINPDEAFSQNFTVNQPKEEEQIDEMPLNITTLVVDEIDDNDEVDFTPTYEEELVDEQENTDSANGVELKITQIDEEETLEQTCKIGTRTRRIQSTFRFTKFSVSAYFDVKEI